MREWSERFGPVWRWSEPGGAWCGGGLLRSRLATLNVLLLVVAGDGLDAGRVSTVVSVRTGALRDPVGAVRTVSAPWTRVDRPHKRATLARLRSGDNNFHSENLWHSHDLRSDVEN
jgi:hypothetical protein